MTSGARRRIGALIVLAALASFSAAAQTSTPEAARTALALAPAPSDPFARADAAIAAAVSRRHISGVSAAVVLGGRLRWSRGYGFADLENRVPFSATTVWRLGSVSKPLTAVAAMQLSEKGRLDLDVPIQTYCPAFPKKPQPISSRQLLGHLAGIRHYNPAENFNSTRHYDGIAASLDAFKDDALVHPPGTAYTYSTYGYVVLGCVVEGASGSKYADYVRENVTAPAKMESTRADDLYAIIPNRARGYAISASGEARNADLADTSNKIPGGGWVSTVEDLARFAIALDENRLIRRDTFERMQVPMRTSDGKESPYFGWSISDRRGDRTLTHTGSQQGTSTCLLMIPSKGFAVALISNTESADMGELARQLADTFLP